METRISVADLKASLEEVLVRVCEHGESFVIEQDGRTLAALGPQPPGSLSYAEFVERVRRLKWPDDKFADDLEAVLSEADVIEEPPRWPD